MGFFLYYVHSVSSLVEPMDYTALSEVLMFAACERRRRVSIIIQEDGVPEQLESFFVTLERTTGLDSRITLESERLRFSILTVCLFI